MPVCIFIYNELNDTFTEQKSKPNAFLFFYFCFTKWLAKFIISEVSWFGHNQVCWPQGYVNCEILNLFKDNPFGNDSVFYIFIIVTKGEI